MLSNLSRPLGRLAAGVRFVEGLERRYTTFFSLLPPDCNTASAMTPREDVRNTGYDRRGAGLMTRSYASDKVESYVQNLSQPWQEGLSFNFINLHLALNPGIDSAVIPTGTPIFSVFPVLNRQCYRYVDRRTMDQIT